MVYVTSIDPPQDVKYQQNAVKAYINGQALDTGSLLIAESRLVWMTSSGMGFSVEYPSITMHAISKDSSLFSEECIWVVLDNAEVDGGGDASSKSTDLYFVPEDPETLTAIFHTIAACQRLHPDETVSDGDEEDENESNWDQISEQYQVIFQQEGNMPHSFPNHAADDVEHLEAAVGRMMSNGETHNVDMEVPSDNENQFEDAECDH